MGKLRGKWGTMAVAALIYVLILGACSALSLIYIGGIAALLLTGALVLGLSDRPRDVFILPHIPVPLHPLDSAAAFCYNRENSTFGGAMYIFCA